MEQHQLWRAGSSRRRAESTTRPRHRGPLQLGPAVVWREERGWRFACPLGCATVRGQAFGSESAAGAAARAHWEEERERELAELARDFRTRSESG